MGIEGAGRQQTRDEVIGTPMEGRGSVSECCGRGNVGEFQSLWRLEIRGIWALAVGKPEKLVGNGEWIGNTRDVCWHTV